MDEAEGFFPERRLLAYPPLHGRLPPVLFYSLAAFFMVVAVAGVGYGIFVGLRTHKRLTGN